MFLYSWPSKEWTSEPDYWFPSIISLTIRLQSEQPFSISRMKLRAQWYLCTIFFRTIYGITKNLQENLMHIRIATLTINLQLYYKLFHINQRGNILRYLTCLCMQSHASLNDGHSHIFYYFIYCDKIGAQPITL